MAGALAIGSDHAGFALKENLKRFLDEREIPYKDFGCYSEASVDYPDIAATVSKAVLSKAYPQGILCCGSGVGVSIAANRFAGIRAVLCHDLQTAMMSRRHNNANIICFGGRMIAPEYAQVLLEAFMNTEFEGSRHQQRVEKMDSLIQQGAHSAC